MSYYGDWFSKTSKLCSNHKKGKGHNKDYEKAYLNSQEKNLRMRPCTTVRECKGYLFAGADSGQTPFCYNFEEKS